MVSAIADRVYAEPSESMVCVGVTGTNGKTTVAWMLSQCGELLGHRCGYIGTLGTGLGEVTNAEGMTTPGAVELHGHLAEFRDAGAEFATLEVSSHALAPERIASIHSEPSGVSVAILSTAALPVPLTSKASVRRTSFLIEIPL